MGKIMKEGVQYGVGGNQIKTVTSTNTTTASGTFIKPTVVQSRKLLGTKCTSQTNVFAFDRGDNYVTVFTVSSNSMTVLENTSVTLEFYYSD